MSGQTVEWCGLLESAAKFHCLTKTLHSGPLQAGNLVDIEMQLRPNICGKIELSLKFPEDWEIEFVATVKCTVVCQEKLCLRTVGVFAGKHLFKGSFISDRVGFSFGVQSGAFTVLLEVKSATPTTREAELKQCVKHLTLELSKQNALGLQANEELGRARVELTALQQIHRNEIATIQKVHANRVDNLKKNHAEELALVQHDCESQLKQLHGERAHIQQLDSTTLEQLLEVTNAASGRIVECLKRKREHTESCKICFDADAEVVLHSCGHMTMCEQCVLKVDQCPICRAPALPYTKVFK